MLAVRVSLWFLRNYGAAKGGGNIFDRISSDYECTMGTGSPVGCRFEEGGNRPKQSEPLPNPCNRFTYLFAPTFPVSLLPPQNPSRDASVTLKLAYYCAAEVISSTFLAKRSSLSFRNLKFSLSFSFRTSMKRYVALFTIFTRRLQIFYMC